MLGLTGVAFVLGLNLAYVSNQDEILKIKGYLSQFKEKALKFKAKVKDLIKKEKKRMNLDSKYISDYLPESLHDLIINWSIFDMYCLTYVLKEKIAT